MPADFGLLVGRYNTATPSLSTDKELRELRLDAAGRIASRLGDGNDKAISFFADGDAVGSGQDDVQNSGAGDRGVLVLGKNDTNSNYQVLKVNDDGSLVVSPNAGTDASEAADKANAADGEVALVSGSWVLVQNKLFSSGKLHLDGWSYASDKNAVFQIALAVAAGTPTRTDITEILDSHITSSARPSDHVGFLRAIQRNGGANVKLCIFAKQLQAGANGVGLSMFNVHTTT